LEFGSFEIVVLKEAVSGGYEGFCVLLLVIPASGDSAEQRNGHCRSEQCLKSLAVTHDSTPSPSRPQPSAL
jgi:hypothetical protein